MVWTLKETNCIFSQQSFLLIINSQSEESAFISFAYCRMHICIDQKLDLYLINLECLRGCLIVLK